MSFLFALALFTSAELASNNVAVEAQTNAEPQYQPVQQLFDGMREHNAEKIANAFVKGATLVRAKQTGQLKDTNISMFASSIAKRKKDYMDEQIIDYRIETFGNMANIWTYFVFYFNGNISHCGVNSIHVIQQDNDWKIAHLMDSAYQGNCEDFIEKYQPK